MKNLVTLLLLVSVGAISAQNNINGTVAKTDAKFEKLDISVMVSALDVSVTVNSIEDIKSTFNIDDIKDIIKDVNDNEALSFAITCEDKTKDSKNHVTYKVKGNTNDIDSFIKSIEVIRKSAIKYFKNRA